MPDTAIPSWDSMTPAQVQRWQELLRGLASTLASGPRRVVVDGHAHADLFADRLADAVDSLGTQCVRLPGDAASPEHDPDHAVVAVAAGAHWHTHPPGTDWDVVIWLRTSAPTTPGHRDGEIGAHIVVDLHDLAWPVIRHVDPSLADRRSWYLRETRAFFAVRAATWDERFGDDLPAYAQAVAQMGIRAGGVAIDVGCGTGRALPALRSAVGPDGTVIGLDLTEQMLLAARTHGRDEYADLVLADARHLPVADARVDAVFAAGLIGHVPEVVPVLTELARVSVADGRLALFHPSGRAALAARRGRPLRGDEPLAEAPLRAAMLAGGWRLTEYDDPPHRFFALATRTR